VQFPWPASMRRSRQHIPQRSPAPCRCTSSGCSHAASGCSRCTWVKGGAAVEQVRRAWLRQAPHAWPGHRVGTTAVPCSCRSGLYPRGRASVSGLRVHSARALRSACCLARGPGQRREQGGMVRRPPARGGRGRCDASLHRTGLHAPGAVRARDSAARRQAVVRRTQVRGHGQSLDPPAPLPRRRLRASSHPRAPHWKC
jgi:hypothetical protein